MWTTVTSFIMPYISKYILPVLIVACIVLGFIVWNQNSTITDLNKKLVTVETKAKLDLALYNSERTLAKSTIDKQNSDIEKYKFDLAAYQRTVTQKEKELLHLLIERRVDGIVLATAGLHTDLLNSILTYSIK